MDGLGLQAELITRSDLAPKADLVQRRQQRILGTATPFRRGRTDENASGLDNGLTQQDAGHNRIAGKMAGEERFVDGHVFERHNPFGSDDLHDSVNEQERVTVGQ